MFFGQTIFVPKSRGGDLGFLGLPNPMCAGEEMDPHPLPQLFGLHGDHGRIGTWELACAAPAVGELHAPETAPAEIEEPAPPARDCDTRELTADPRRLPSCDLAFTAGEAACAARERIGLVVDHDHQSKANGVWAWLAEPLGIDSEICHQAGASQALLDHPIERCASIQQLGAAGAPARLDRWRRCHPTSGLAGRLPAGSQTPASSAFTVACKAITDPAPADRADLVLFAFDGVPDETGEGQAHSDFGTAVQKCAEEGTSIVAVAWPEQYRYLYLLSSRAARAHALEVADALSALLAAQAPAGAVGEPAVWSLTPPTAQSALTAVRPIAVGSHGRVGGDLGETRDAAGMLQVDVADWARGRGRRTATWSFTWGAAAEMGSDALCRSGIIAHTSSEPSRAGSHPQAVRWERPDAPAWPTTSQRFYEVVELEPGRATLGLVRSPRDDASDSAWASPWAADPQRQRAWRAALHDGGTAPALAFSLPPLADDPCARQLYVAVSAAGTWGRDQDTWSAMESAAPALSATCAGSPLLPLVEAFGRTESADFPGSTRRDRAAEDRRVGLGSFAGALRGAAEAVRTSKAWSPVAGGCLLGGLETVASIGPEEGS